MAKPPADVVEQDEPSFKFADSPDVKFSVEGSMTLQAQQLSVHEGRIQGLNTAVQSVQSSLNFWQTAALGLGGAILALLTVLVTYQMRDSSNHADQDKLLSERITSLEVKVDALPGQISESLRSTSRDLVLITQGARNQKKQDAPSAD